MRHGHRHTHRRTLAPHTKPSRAVAQDLEGLQALFETMHVPVGTPALYCDNRAACHLTAGSSEWRTKALVDKIMGVKSLIQYATMCEFMLVPTEEEEIEAEDELEAMIDALGQADFEEEELVLFRDEDILGVLKE